MDPIVHRSVLLGAVLAVTLAASPLFAASADDYYAEARAHLAKGEIKSAIIELKNALQADPTHVQARVALGTLHLRNADGAAAAKEFSRARELGALADLWMLGYARALVLQGEFRQLLEETSPDADLPDLQKAELLALRGNAHLALREVDAAVEEYDAALELQSGNAMARLGKAQVLLAANHEDEALEQLNEVLAEDPGHVESRLVRGDLLRRMQRLDDARVDYERAAKDAPNNPRAHIGLSLVHIVQRDVDAAKRDLEVLDRITKGTLPALNYLRALVSFQEGDYGSASDELQSLLRVAPSNLQAQLLYGIVSYAREEYTLADDYLSRVLSSVPGNSQVIKLVGAARLKLKQPDRASEVLESVVSDETQDAQLLALLGTAYIQMGDNERGARLIERAVELDPDQALLRTQLAVGKIATGDTSEAISQLESAVALGQDVVQADVLLVLSYLNKREYEKAIAASQALEARMADSPIPQNLTGLAYLAQRQFDLAREHFNAALKKDPKFLVARMNLARVAMVEQKPDVADAAYDEVLRIDPKHLGAMLGKAQLARERGDQKGVQDWLLKANQANPAAIRPIMILAETYLRQNEGLKAVNMLSDLSPDQARLPPVLRLKGMAQLQSGDFVSAVLTLKELTDVAPSVEAWFQLARAYAAKGDSAAAREAFKQSVALDTAYKAPIALVGLGELELREREFQSALAVGETLQQRYPGLVYGYDVAAAAYRGLGQVEKSIDIARRALEIEYTAQRVDAFAKALAAAGNRSESQKVLRDWLGKHPDDGKVWATLGMVSQQAGQDREALKAYEESLRFAEPDAVLANNMAWLYLEHDRERAIELATKAYELAPSRAEIVDTYGWVLFRSGRKNDGLAALQQAMIIAPRNPEIALHVGEALIDMRRDAEARPVLERVARDNPDTDFAKSARALIAKLRG